MLPKGGSELEVRKEEADWVVMYAPTIDMCSELPSNSAIASSTTIGMQQPDAEKETVCNLLRQAEGNQCPCQGDAQM